MGTPENGLNQGFHEYGRVTPQIGVQNEYPRQSRMRNHKLDWYMANKNDEKGQYLAAMIRN